MSNKCCFAYAGTYGHECGRPAVWAQQVRGEGYTVDGMYWLKRCDECRTIHGGENVKAARNAWVPFDSAAHVNRFR